MLKKPAGFKSKGALAPLKTDMGIAIAFFGAIAVLLLVAGYVLSRVSVRRMHLKKWQDYDDCGWA